MGLAPSAQRAIPGSEVHERALGFPNECNGISVRLITEADLPIAAAICQKAFNDFNASVGLAPEFPPPEVADVPRELLGPALSDGFRGFAAVKDGEVVGSALVSLQDEVAAIGPVSSSVAGGGRLVVQACMKAAAEAGFRAVRLHQVAANTRSFSLYLSLGFDPIVSVNWYEGSARGPAPAGYTAATLTEDDVEACSTLHFAVCKVHRHNEIRACIGSPHPNCVVRDAAGKVAAYSTGCHLGGHSAARDEEALARLIVHQSEAIAAARDAGAPLPPVLLLVPHTYPGFMRRLPSQGFRLMRQIVQMGYGPRAEPSGGFYLPSMSY